MEHIYFLSVVNLLLILNEYWIYTSNSNVTIKSIALIIGMIAILIYGSLLINVIFEEKKA